MADLNRDNDQQLDEMLDSLLNNYSAVQPRPGLETRILAHVHAAAQNARPSFVWNFKWAWAAAALAAIMIGAVLIGGHRKTAVSPAVVHVAQPVPMQSNQQPGQSPKIIASAANHLPKNHAQPTTQSASLPVDQRPDIFPTPEPLSEEEKLLVRYVARTPREELMAQSRPFEPFRLEDKSGSDIQKPKQSTEAR